MSVVVPSVQTAAEWSTTALSVMGQNRLCGVPLYPWWMCSQLVQTADRWVEYHYTTRDVCAGNSDGVEYHCALRDGYAVRSGSWLVGRELRQDLRRDAVDNCRIFHMHSARYGKHCPVEVVFPIQGLLWRRLGRYLNNRSQFLWRTRTHELTVH